MTSKEMEVGAVVDNADKACDSLVDVRRGDHLGCRKRCVLVLAAMLIALAGCGGTGNQPSDGADRNKLIEAARCMRANGFPDYPDPIEDDGIWVIPEPAADLTPPPACLELFRAAKGRPPARQLTAEELTQRRKWADCIRKNGIPNLPDPDSNGNFQLPPELTPITSQPGWDKAREACRSFEWPGVDFNK